MFTVSFDTSNDAFNEPESEIASVLTKLADEVRGGNLPADIPMRLRDTNGNRIGYAIYEV